MYKQYLLLCCVLTAVCLTESITPTFIKKCKAEDSKCIKESTDAAIPIITRGLPDLKVEPLDPLHIKFINASQANLLFVLSDVTAVGLSKCKPKKIHRDVAKSKIICTFICSGKFDGHYELKGSILVVPIEGNGKIHVDLRAAEINIYMDIVDKIGEDGKNHWQIKTWSHDFELKDKSDVVFENLYDGNEVLGRAARELVANNGNDIIKEIGPPVIKTLVNKALKCVNHFFKAVPSEDLSLD